MSLNLSKENPNQSVSKNQQVPVFQPKNLQNSISENILWRKRVLGVLWSGAAATAAGTNCNNQRLQLQEIKSEQRKTTTTTTMTTTTTTATN